MITIVGTGGVGKTSLSLALSVLGCQQGRRVATVTVDPSRRLFNLLAKGNEPNSQFSVKVSADLSLDVFSVNTPELFSEFVSQNMSPSLFNKLSGNRIFKQISQNLRETHNFAAIYQMMKVMEQDKYDLVILDTPPCHQVMDFFDSPKRLQSFFSSQLNPEDSSWSNWFQKKGMQVAEGFLSRLVGKEFVDQMEGFFSTVGGLRSQIYDLSSRFLEKMGQDSSQLALVYLPVVDKMEEAIYLHKSLSQREFQVNHFVMNRAYIDPRNLNRPSESQYSVQEEQIYKYFVEKEKQSFKMAKNIKDQVSSEKTHFSLIPEVDMDLNRDTDFFKFSQYIQDHWRRL